MYFHATLASCDSSASSLPQRHRRIVRRGVYTTHEVFHLLRENIHCGLTPIEGNVESLQEALLLGGVIEIVLCPVANLEDGGLDSRQLPDEEADGRISIAEFAFEGAQSLDREPDEVRDLNGGRDDPYD